MNGNVLYFVFVFNYMFGLCDKQYVNKVIKFVDI